MRFLQWPDFVIDTVGTCLFGKKLLRTGIRISSGFVAFYDVCHDTGLDHTYYTKFILTRDAAGFQSGVARPDWSKLNFFP